MTTAIDVVRKELNVMMPEFAQVLPPHLPVERLGRSIISACSINPRLLDCDRRSLWRAAMTAAVLGIEPDGVTGQGYFVPFKGKVQFIPGYKGIITLAANWGYLVRGHVVRKADKFRAVLGTDEHVEHEPALDAPMDAAINPIIGAYATARHRTMPAAIEYMPLELIMRARDRSQGYQAAKRGGASSPWDTDFAEMARKTPVRQLGDQLPLSVQRALALERAHDQGKVAHATKIAGGAVEIDMEATEVADDAAFTALEAEADAELDRRMR